MYVVFLRDTLENDVLLAFRNYTATLLTKEPGICVVRQKYLQMDPNTVVQEVNLMNIFFIFSVVNEKDSSKKQIQPVCPILNFEIRNKNATKFWQK